MLGLVTAITNLAGTWVSAKAESTKATAEAKATALKTAAQSTADWERIMAEASKNSWKDEWLTIVFSIPLIRSVYDQSAQLPVEGKLKDSSTTSPLIRISKGRSPLARAYRNSNSCVPE